MILVEFGIIEKSELYSKFLNSSRQQFELSEKKYFKPNETTKLQDEVVILNKKTSNNNESIKSVKGDLIKGNKNHTDFVKVQFEPVKNLTNKNAIEIISSNNKISDNINSIESVKDDLTQNQKEIKKKNSKIETIKILTDNSNNSIEVMLIEIKKIFKNSKNLFKNLDVDNFIAMVFKGENKNNSKKLKEEELKNVYAIITLMIKEKKIHSIDSELARILIKYFDLEVTPKTVKNRIAEKKKDQNFLISKINENSIIDKISKI
jgi:hypothetical protein